MWVEGCSGIGGLGTGQGGEVRGEEWENRNRRVLGSSGQSESRNDIPFIVKHREGAVWEWIWTHYQTRLRIRQNMMD